ncbi:hypothetical protein QTO30_10160 [Yoonia sp. GPGPB17]|uniref:hypothetical protein n=1 Tax=Yoonia sp. GPGPB17 TaxID=3026147 RepID=UPI0030BCB0BC
MTGARRKMIQSNEREALSCAHRDQEQRDELILAQMEERGMLLERAHVIRNRHKQECKQMAKTIRLYMLQSEVNRAENKRRKAKNIGFDR